MNLIYQNKCENKYCENKINSSYIKRIIKGLAPKLSEEVLNKNYLEISITIGICLVIWIFTNCFYKSSLFLTQIIKNYYI